MNQTTEWNFSSKRCVTQPFKRVFAIAVWFVLGTAVVAAQNQQTPSSNATIGVLPPERALDSVGLPSQAVRFRRALIGVFDGAGHERRILTGSVSMGGTQTSFVFTRELDQNVRLDLGDANQEGLIVTQLNTPLPAKSVTTGSGAASWAYDLLEVLADDSPEAFLFSFGTAARLVWIGPNYQLQGADESGPRSDVYSKTAAVATQPGSPKRTKVFMFDSATKLLTTTRYRLDSGTTSVEVEIKFTGWTSLSGQIVPTTITRFENGQSVFSVTINSVLAAPAQLDSLFAVGN